MKSFDKRIPKPTFVTKIKRSDGFCDRAPGIVLRCPFNFRCWLCEYAERMQRFNFSDPVPLSCIDESQIVRSAKGKGLSYYGKIVAVQCEYLDSIDKRQLLYYQLFKCTDGPGCLPENPVGEIDGYFISDPNKCVTLLRSHILGIPVLEVCKRADRAFFTNTVRECGHLEESEVVSDDCVQLKIF